MPFSLSLSADLRNAGWKVKIHDFERLEPPHVTIYFKMKSWRLSLRTGAFLERSSQWSQIAEGVKKAILEPANWRRLRENWDKLHPDNPIESSEEEKREPGKKAKGSKEKSGGDHS